MIKRNLFIISLNYFTQTIFTSFISTYLALYLMYNTNMDEGEIALLILIAPLPLLIRPYLGKLIDRTQNIKLIFILGIGCYMISIVGMGLLTSISSLMLKILPVFGAYLGLSIFDCVGDKYMTFAARNDSSSSIIWISIASLVGRTIVGFLFVSLIGTNLSSSKWVLLFGLMGLLTTPLAIYGFFKYPQIIQFESQQSALDKKPILTKEMKKSVFIIILLSFVVNIRALADIIYEPYLVAKFGAEAFVGYNYLILFSSYIGIIVYPFIQFYRKKFMTHRIFWILITGSFSLLFWITLAGNSFTAILILTTISPIFSSILYVSYISIFIDGSPKGKSNLFYQLYSTTYWIFGILLNALGVLLTKWVASEIILMITGILLVSGLFVLPKLKLDVFKSPATAQSQTEITVE